MSVANVEVVLEDALLSTRTEEVDEELTEAELAAEVVAVLIPDDEEGEAVVDDVELDVDNGED